MKDKIKEVLSSFAERDRQVIVERFGLAEGKPKTLEEVGIPLKVTRERVRQIEAKVLSRMRQPEYAKQLEVFLES